MKEEKIKEYLSDSRLRNRQTDKAKIESMIKSAENTAEVTLAIPLAEKSAIVILREIYEAIRQLGEAQWWILGYEPIGYATHETALEALKDLNIKEKVKLNFLDRFKEIRNNANYRGFVVTINQAQDIILLWRSCGKDIISNLRKQASDL